jgi:hypothetical protein
MLAVIAVRRGGQLDHLDGPAVRRTVPITHTGMMPQVRRPFAPYGKAAGHQAARPYPLELVCGFPSKARALRPATVPLPSSATAQAHVCAQFQRPNSRPQFLRYSAPQFLYT